MNTTLKLLLVALCVLFFGCNNDENQPGGASSITNDGVLSGKIVDYVPNPIDSVMALGESFKEKWSGSIVSTGDFSVRITVPELSKFGTMSGLTVSDSTAMTGTIYVYVYRNKRLTGVLKKSNYDTDTISKAGMSYSSFVYSDRAFTVKGTHLFTNKSDNMTYTNNDTYQITLKKGWNELVYRINNYTITTNSISSSTTLSNTIPSDLQWYIFKL